MRLAVETLATLLYPPLSILLDALQRFQQHHLNKEKLNVTPPKKKKKSQTWSMAIFFLSCNKLTNIITCCLYVSGKLKSLWIYANEDQMESNHYLD